MKYVLAAMPAFLRASLQTMFQYRGEIVLWAVWGVVYPAVAMSMWSAASRDAIGGGDIQGFGPPEFAAYFLLTMIIGHFSTAWDIYEMGYLVNTGRMSPKLLRPLLPIWESISDNVAYKVLTLAILVPIWLAVAWWAQPHFQTSADDLLFGVPATLLAAAVNYLLCYNLALSAFWITRTEGIGELWFGASLFFGGRLAPLSILPLPVQWVADVLPFKWTIWFPSAALMGRFDRAELIAGVCYQTAWLVGLIVLFRLLWRAAVRRYSAVGA